MRTCGFYSWRGSGVVAIPGHPSSAECAPLVGFGPVTAGLRHRLL